MLGIKLEIDEKSVQEASKKINKAETKTRQPTPTTTAPAATGIAGIGKGIMAMLGKVLLPLLGLFAIWKGLEPILSPILKLIGAVMMLLFLPLIPLLMPVMKLLGEMAKTLAPIMTDILEKVSDAIDEGGLAAGFETFIDEVMPLLVQGFETLMTDVVPKIIPIIVKGFISFVKGVIIALPQIISAMVEGFKILIYTLVEVLKEDWVNSLLTFMITLLALILGGVIAAITGLTFGWAVAIGVLIVGIIFYVANWLSQRIPTWLNWISNVWKGFVDKLKSVINSIISRIQSAISRIPFIGSREKRSVDDALITSDGRVIEFNPNDNIMAFQGEIPQTGGGDIIINVQGFVGDEDMLADRISKVISARSRGGRSLF